MDTDAIVTAHAASPTTFSILDRMQNRGYPEEEVTFYLDEKLAWVLLQLEEKHRLTQRAEDLGPIEEDIASVREALASSKYTATMRGITNEEYDAIVDETEEAHPYEYTEEFNPLSGRKIKEVIPSQARDNLFNNLFLAKVIVKFTDPSGAVDEDITPELVASIKKVAPIDAIRRLSNTATEMRMVGEWMNGVETEDFTLKP